MVKKAELVFVPLPAMGHLLSSMEVAKILVELSSNLSITVLFVNLPHDSKIRAYIESLIANNFSTRIKFIVLSQDDTGSASKRMPTIIQEQRPRIKEVVANMVQRSSSEPDSPRLAGFVLDMFFTSLIDLVNEFNVPSYVFYTSSAAFLGFQFNALTLQEESNFNFPELKDSDIEFSIPSYVNPVSSKFFPDVYLKPETLAMVNSAATGLRHVNGILVNTFKELESHAVNSLSLGRNPSVYPVGPLVNLEDTSGEENHRSDVMKWLDEQPPSSVVFLCFGSMGSFGIEQVKHIACALEQSGHRFLWSLRKGTNPKSDKGPTVSGSDYENVAEVLPEGFLDRTAGMGKIIGWAPQVAILRHDAIGGFVSHCGWNSTLESIWFEVPIATWPLYAEQQLNAFAVVKELGIGVEMKMDYKKDFMWSEKELESVEIVEKEQIARVIKCLMEQESEVRKRVKEMSEKSKKALMDGGSSYSTLCRFVQDVFTNIMHRRDSASASASASASTGLSF